MIQKLKKSNEGFTLVELIVVIAILGILAAVLVPNYIQYIERSREGTDVSTLGEVLHMAQIEAATSETFGAITINIDNTSGLITAESTSLPKAAIAITASHLTLSSVDGKAFADPFIVFDANRTAGWAATANGAGAKTATFFSTLG